MGKGAMTHHSGPFLSNRGPSIFIPPPTQDCLVVLYNVTSWEPKERELSPSPHLLPPSPTPYAPTTSQFTQSTTTPRTCLPMAYPATMAPTYAANPAAQ